MAVLERAARNPRKIALFTGTSNAIAIPAAAATAWIGGIPLLVVIALEIIVADRCGGELPAKVRQAFPHVRVLEASPGLKSMLDLPVPAAIPSGSRRG